MPDQSWCIWRNDISTRRCLTAQMMAQNIRLQTWGRPASDMETTKHQPRVSVSLINPH